jgi:hypothetical protein
MFGSGNAELEDGWGHAQRRGYDRLLDAMAILSDAQEILERGHPGCDANARQLIDRAKHFLISGASQPAHPDGPRRPDAVMGAAGHSVSCAAISARGPPPSRRSWARSIGSRRGATASEALPAMGRPRAKLAFRPGCW